VNQVTLKQAMAELLSAEPAAAVDAHRALASGKAARRSRRLKISASGAVLAAALVAAIPASRSFLAGDRATPPAVLPTVTPSPPPPTAPYVGYPNSIAVIGHTTAAGYHSDPANLAATIKANSWATGTNPLVNSLYERILANNPTIRGHNVNLSDINAVMGDARSQAGRAVVLKPLPDLVVMQVLDYDMDCPAYEGAFARVRSALVGALQTLRQYAPNTRVFVVSQFGSSRPVATTTVPSDG
jgi:hypothetical protein